MFAEMNKERMALVSTTVNLINPLFNNNSEEILCSRLKELLPSKSGEGDDKISSIVMSYLKKSETNLDAEAAGEQLVKMFADPLTDFFKFLSLRPAVEAEVSRALSQRADAYVIAKIKDNG